MLHLYFDCHHGKIGNYFYSMKNEHISLIFSTLFRLMFFLSVLKVSFTKCHRKQTIFNLSIIYILLVCCSYCGFRDQIHSFQLVFLCVVASFCFLPYSLFIYLFAVQFLRAEKKNGNEYRTFDENCLFFFFISFVSSMFDIWNTINRLFAMSKSNATFKPFGRRFHMIKTTTKN